MYFESIQKMSLSEFQEICKNLPKISQRKNNWLSLITANKLTCPITNETVFYCSLDVQKSSKNILGSKHYNFYSANGQLFTIDHIIPKSKNGKDTLDNIQPMIESYNYLKSDKFKTNEEFLQHLKKIKNEII